MAVLVVVVKYFSTTFYHIAFLQQIFPYFYCEDVRIIMLFYERLKTSLQQLDLWFIYFDFLLLIR